MKCSLRHRPAPFTLNPQIEAGQGQVEDWEDSSVLFVHFRLASVFSGRLDDGAKSLVSGAERLLFRSVQGGDVRPIATMAVSL